MLLYSVGDTTNLIIGILAGFGWLAYRMIRHHPRKELMAAMARSWALFILLTIGLVYLFRPVPADNRPDMPTVTLTRENGEDWKSSDAYGYPLVLNFWASWCPPCRAEMPMLDRFVRDGKLGNTMFWAVNAVETERGISSGRDWLTENNVDLPILLDTSSRASIAYGVSALPTTVVLDAQGRLVARKTGAISRSWLARSLREARSTEDLK
jgi:thiol-disulfide isomerase/thioredoxin